VSHLVELYTTENCGLCEEARKTLTELKATVSFELREVKLTPEHRSYSRYVLSTPVLLIDGKVELPAPFDVHRVMEILLSDQQPSALFYIGKGLEALGLISVACGLTTGLLGDMRTEGYLFVSGIGLFAIGWLIERKHRKSFPSADATSKALQAENNE
jgi:glutaredoxin